MEAGLRRALRVLRLVHELHKRGYQLLRIAPGMSPSGCHWRCSITPRCNIRERHGAMLSENGWDRFCALYTSAQGNEYFGWEDAQHDTVQKLAQKFTERFPDIVEASQADDWNYAGWYVRMLGYAERGFLPIAYADWYGLQPDPRFLPLTKTESDLPMPPPGGFDEEGSIE